MMLEKLTKVSESELVQAGMWLSAFVGVSVLVGLGKVAPTMLENLLFALIGAMAAKRNSNVQSV